MAVLDRTASFSSMVAPASAADPLATILVSQIRQAQMLAKLALIAEPRSAPGVADLAGRMLGYLMLELPRDLDDEEALLVALEGQPEVPPALEAVADALREEQGAIHQLLPSVTRGLRYLSVGRMPAAPGSFSAACAVLLEFMRLHAAYVQGTLLPLARRLAGPEALASLALDIACRREANDPRRLQAPAADAEIPAPAP